MILNVSGLVPVAPQGFFSFGLVSCYKGCHSDRFGCVGDEIVAIALPEPQAEEECQSMLDLHGMLSSVALRHWDESRDWEVLAEVTPDNCLFLVRGEWVGKDAFREYCQETW